MVVLHVDYILAIEQLPAECIEDCSRPGPADAAVRHWREVLGFSVARERAIDCMAGYGAWERHKLESETDDDIAERILWLACGDFAEWDGTEDSPCGSDIFVLE